MRGLILGVFFFACHSFAQADSVPKLPDGFTRNPPKLDQQKQVETLAALQKIADRHEAERRADEMRDYCKKHKCYTVP